MTPVIMIGEETKSIFLQSPHGASALQSLKMTSKAELRAPKPPKPPEKPLMPYMRYSRKVWEQVKNSNPHLKLWEVGKIIGQMWRELPDDEKTLYIEEYDSEKILYTEALRQYHSSPAYQAWLVAKERAEKLLEEQDQERKQSITRSRDRPGDMTQADLRESYMLEDNEEESEDQYTVKHVAAARFQRNHRLMQEILSDSRLPDPGQLITQSRLNTLRLQVEQLKSHKRNLCQEIEGCELRHRSKLQRIQEDSDKFVADYQKLTAARPMITEAQFAEMIIKAKHDEEERLSLYLAEAELRRRKQQQRQQQREAELAAESERRRQQLHQQQLLHQARLQQSQGAEASVQPHSSNGRNIERSSAAHEMNESVTQMSSKPHTPQLPTVANSKVDTPLTEPVSQSVSGPYASGVSNSYPHAPAQPGQRFPQVGHTQHHYPPPPNYPPNAISPSLAQQIGMSPRGHSPAFQQMFGAPGLPKATPSGVQKKNVSSSSSTSSGSSASSASSKRKKSDTGIGCDNGKSKRPDGGMEASASAMIPDRRGIPGDVGPDQSRHVELPTGPNPPGEYMQTQPQPPLVRHPAPQQYVQSPQPMPTGGSAAGHPPTPVAPASFGYEHGPPMNQGSSMPSNGPPSGYYPPSMQQPSAATGNFSSQSRPQFTHVGYGPGHYPPGTLHAPSPSDHPPPPMYVQHMTQQQHQQPPHIAQQQGPPIMGSPPHSVGHPHQGSSAGWHHSGPTSYPPSQYAGPRYPGPGTPVGYTTHVPRHVPATGGGYGISHPGVLHPGQHPHQPIPGQPPPTSEPGVTGQPIPAPPPYQQQQGHGNFPPGYWSASHSTPQDYGSIGQQSPYISTLHPELPSMPHPSSSVDSVQSNASIPNHPHTESGLGHMNSQHPHHAGVYYQGYPPHPLQGSYGPPGFYVSSQPQGGQYPPQSSPVAWGGYPMHTNQHVHGYQSHGQSHHLPQPSSIQPGSSGAQNSSKVEATGTAVNVPSMEPSGGGSRPPSVSSHGQTTV